MLQVLFPCDYKVTDIFHLNLFECHFQQAEVVKELRKSKCSITPIGVVRDLAYYYLNLFLVGLNRWSSLVLPKLSISDFVNNLWKEEVVSVHRCERSIDNMGGLGPEEYSQSHVPMLLEHFTINISEMPLIPDVIKVVPKIFEGRNISIANGKLDTKTFDSCIRRIVEMLILCLLHLDYSIYWIIQSLHINFIIVFSIQLFFYHSILIVVVFPVMLYSKLICNLWRISCVTDKDARTSP